MRPAESIATTSAAHRIAIPRRRAAAGIALALGLGTTIGLTGCAPEPGSAEVAGHTEKGAETPNPESSWSAPVDDLDADAKRTTLPEDFPVQSFPIPAGAEIDDTGARDGAWFVVLRAQDASDADRLWRGIVVDGGFTESGAESTAEGGRSATLTSAALIVSALTLPQSDGSVLLSYDLEPSAD